MDYMFRSASVFNQDIYGWCVQDIPVKPVDFDRFAPSAWTDIKKPQWGSCPFEHAFIMEWKTDNPGVSATDEIRIPTAGSGHNFTVYWGDGSSDSYTETPATGYVAHTYLEEGTYYVKILGDFPHIYFNNAGDRQKLLDIRKWGSIAWASFENAFYGCTNLNISATDVPLTSEVISMAGMFRDCSSLNAPIIIWDVSGITQMENMFNGASSFNQDLSGWCVSHLAIEPAGFATGATAWVLDKPLWGADCDYLLTFWNSNLTSTGSSENDQISLPMIGGGYNFTVYWGNGQSETYINNSPATTTHNLLHTYAAPGNYLVRISGDFPRFYFNDTGDKLKLLDIIRWGSNEYSSMARAFYGCANLSITATDAPDLSSVEDMSYMFYGAKNFNQAIGHWNTSQVIDMMYMFYQASKFNQPISNWNTSKVKNMGGMFSSADDFNQPIGSWNTSKVTNMGSMFSSADEFNQPIGGWNTANVNQMNRMFNGANAFDQDISGWCVELIPEKPFAFDGSTPSGWTDEKKPQWGTCPYDDAFVMLWNTENPGGSASNQIRIPIAGSGHNFTVYWGDDSFDIYSETPLSGYVEHTYDDAGLYVVKITGDFPHIYFNNAGDRQKLLEIRNWGSIAWMSFENAFYGCTNLTISAADVPLTSEVTSMAAMFRDCSSLNAPLYSWDVSSIVQMDNMFNGATNFNQDLSGWCVSQIITEPIGFATGATAWDLPKPQWGMSCDFLLTHWNTTLTSSGSSANNQIRIPMRGGGYDFTVYWGDGQFENYISDPSPNTTHSLVHTYDLPGNYMVRIYGSIPRIYFNNGGDKLKLLEVLHWGPNEYASMGSAFYGCENLSIPAADAPDLSNVEDMSFMLAGASGFNQQIAHWNTSYVTNMNGMFNSATNFNKPLDDWNTTNVVTMNSMFLNATSFNQPIGNWNTSSVTNMNSMFWNAESFNQDLSGWCVTNITTMPSGFDFAANLWTLPNSRPVWGTCP